MYQLAADFVLLIHLAFIVFVAAGGLLAFRWPRVVWVHLPAMAWGIFVEASGTICPLTPLEDALRALAGTPVDPRDFIARTLLPLIYPTALTRELQWTLAGLVALVNLLVYGALWRRRAGKKKPAGRASRRAGETTGASARADRDQNT